MTRDEAYDIMETAFCYSDSRQTWEFNPNQFITVLERLGMLKLDEPESAEKILFNYLAWPKFGTKQTEVHNALCDANLMVVKRPK